MDRFTHLVSELLGASRWHEHDTWLHGRRSQLIYIERDTHTNKFFVTVSVRSPSHSLGREDVGDDGGGCDTLEEAMEYTLTKIKERRALLAKRKGLRKGISTIDEKLKKSGETAG